MTRWIYLALLMGRSAKGIDSMLYVVRCVNKYCIRKIKFIYIWLFSSQQFNSRLYWFLLNIIICWIGLVDRGEWRNESEWLHASRYQLRPLPSHQLKPHFWFFVSAFIIKIWSLKYKTFFIGSFYFVSGCFMERNWLVFKRRVAFFCYLVTYVTDLRRKERTMRW